MPIDRLSIEAIPQPEQVQPLPEGAVRESAQNQENPEVVRADQVFLTGRVGILYNQLQLRNEWQSGVAGSIRHAARKAGEVGQKIDALKEPLEKIVKNFPPFPPDSEERKKLLRSYSSIRKEIDDLTVPPPPEVVKARQRVELPAPISESADDRQIADHLSKLEGAVVSLKELRKELAATAESLSGNKDLSSLLGRKKNEEKRERSQALTEREAGEVSAQVGRQFATSIKEGVSGDDHTPFLKGLS